MFHTVKLSKSDPTPLYIQLASELSKLISANLLTEGMKLPTIRQLSKQLFINRDTVVSAYKLLEQQGLVESHIGKGTYIASHVHLDTCATIPLQTRQPYLCCSHLNLSPDFYPSTLCQELTMQIVTSEGWEAFSDPLYRERHALKQSATHFLESLGITANFAQTRIITSMESFIMSLFKLSPKNGICVEMPRDLALSCYLKSIGAKIYEVPMTTEGMDLDVLEKYLHTGLISYIFLTSYLQNPTGTCYSHAYKMRILELAAQYDVFIIEDGTYCDFVAPSTTYTPLYHLCKDNRVIYLYHFSKIYLPYMKYSLAVLPPTLIKRLNDEVECSFNERFLHYYLSSTAFSQVRSTIHHTCKERYTYLIDTLSNYALPSLTFHASGALWIWCQIPLEKSSYFWNMLTQKEIILAPGDLFSSAPHSDYFRLSITSLSLQDIDLICSELTHILSS